MFCPRCGSNQSEELRFCKTCGANLYAVRQLVDDRAADKFDWSKTWVAEMFLSGEEQQRRKFEMERRRGITPAIRRYQEIKAGVITACSGFGVGTFLFFLMEGIIRSGEVTAGEAEILSRIWTAGFIPVLVGLALIINGYFVSRKIVELTSQNEQPGLRPQESEPQLPSASTNEFIPTRMSVTEGTTKHLGTSPNSE